MMGSRRRPQDVSFARCATGAPGIHQRHRSGGPRSRARRLVHRQRPNGSSGNNSGTVFIDLKPKPPRSVTPDQVIARLRPKLAAVTGINLYLQSIQDVRVGGRPSRTQYQYTLQDADLSELRTWAPRVLERLKKMPELKDVATDQQMAGLELDARRRPRHGVSAGHHAAIHR